MDNVDKRVKGCISVAALLAGVGAVYYFVPAMPEIEQARLGIENAAKSSDQFRLAQRRGDVEDCLQAARMVYAVHWAAACTSEVGQPSQGIADGHAECDLPHDKAAVVNAWLNEAEERCVVEVRAGLGP
jgi:hypothetical protein